MEAIEPPDLPDLTSNFTGPLATHQGSPLHVPLKWHDWKWFQGCITTCLVFLMGPNLPLMKGPTSSHGVYSLLWGLQRKQVWIQPRQIWGASAPVVQRESVDLATKQGLQHP